MKKTVIALLVIACAAIAQAKVVTPEQAKNIACNFLQTSLHKQVTAEKLTVATSTARRAASKTQNSPAYYVFNASDAFVVVAGDDRMPAVLGYSDNGIIDPNDMPDGLKDLLECYAVEATRLTEGDGYPTPNGSISRSAIAPLVKSKWNQSAPFNLNCPTVDDNGTHAATGCVATAMAQVMNYHKWPNTISQAIPAYTTSTLEIEMPALSVSGYPGFGNIKDYYTYSETDTKAQAVAKFMLYCGQALQMNYNKSSSASTSYIPEVLNSYFRYAPSARYVNRNRYTAEEWASLIYTELAAGRPVVYRGSAYNGGGHSYVLDGIDADGLFHINWGWQGKSDGYFLITNLNPDDHGIGSSLSNDGYIVGSAMVIGITPDNKPISTIDNTPMYCTNLEQGTSSYTRASSSQSFSNVVLHWGNYSQLSEVADVDFGVALYNASGTLVTTLYSSWFSQLKPGYGNTGDRTFDFPASIGSGTYTIKPVCRLHNTGSWVPSAGANVNYWQATVTSTKLTLKLMGNNAEPSYRVNSVVYNGIKQTNRPVEFVANITNTGGNYFRYLYLLVDGDAKTIAHCAVEPGQTGDVSMHFTCADAGTHTLKLCYDEDGNNVLWSGNVSIAASPSALISMSSVSVKNLVSGTKNINDDKFTVSVKATNSGNDYTDYIEGRIYRRSGSNSGSMISSIAKSVSIASNRYKTVTFEFTDLVPGEEYFVIFYYYSGGVLTKGSSTSFYTILGSPYDSCDINKDGVVDVSDLNIIISRILGDSSTDTYNRADVNGDGVVDVTDINLVISKILAQ